MNAKPIKPIIPPPLKPGQVLDPNSDYAKYWTGLPEWVQFDDKMTLKLPAQFTPFWTHKDFPNVDFAFYEDRPKHFREIDSFSFSMFMPDFGGYTPDNYLSELSEDEIKIISIDSAPMSYAEPDAPGYFPPNMWKRVTTGRNVQLEKKYGLDCFTYTNNKPEGVGVIQYCYGLRDAKLGEYIFLEIIIPPYPEYIKYPIMKAKYFTKQYGGLEIIWWAHMKYVDRWQEIDQQIWQHVKDWNVETAIK